MFLAEQGFEVTAVDSSAAGLRKARELAAQKGVIVETVEADLSDYDPGNEHWDNIISVFCHLPQVQRRGVHKACVTGLKAGGIFLLEAYTPRQLEFGTGGPPLAEWMPDLTHLRSELTGLTETLGREVVREVFEGKGHHGPGSVVQFVARKAG